MIFSSPIENEADLSDTELVHRALLHSDSFSLIVRRYWSPLFRYVKRISFFNDEDTEDILQEVFIKIYRYLNDFDHNLTFSTWIYHICRNAVIDAIRKKQSRPQTTDINQEDISNLFRASTNIADEIALKEHLNALITLIYELPLKYREVLILKFLEEKTYEEIMDIVKKPKGTIASLINRGRKILTDQARTKGLLPSQIKTEGIAFIHQ